MTGGYLVTRDGVYDLEGEDSLETGLRLTGRLVRSWSRGQGRVVSDVGFR